MDNRITKKRLRNAFQYESVIMLAIVFVVLVVFEFLYGFLATRITPGQYFKLYYDSGIYNGNKQELFAEIKSDKTLSYDVLRFDSEDIVKNTNLLRQRTLIYEGDIIITDFVKDEDDRVKVKTYADEFDMYSFEALYQDAVEYLSSFLKDEFLASENKQELITDYANLDEGKIEQNFSVRMKKDNRFRWDKAKWNDGLDSEKARISKLCSEVKDFSIVLKVGKERDIFYQYTRYEQAKDNPLTSSNHEQYKNLYNKEISEGRVNLSYAIKAEMLTGGRVNPSKYFKLNESEQGAKDVAIMVFDFLHVQQDLQFETISFINTIVTTCSDILN